MLRKLIINLLFAFVALVLVWGTLLIPRSVKFPERVVELGYPVSFMTLDFGPNTRGGGAVDNYLKRRRYNIKSSWERPTETSWPRFILSYVILFFGIFALWKILWRVFNKRIEKLFGGHYFNP